MLMLGIYIFMTNKINYRLFKYLYISINIYNIIIFDET